MYLQLENVKKSYGEEGSYVEVLKGVTTGVERGEMCVIQGTSGSGKSTFKLHRRTGYDEFRFHLCGWDRTWRHEK